MDEPTVYVGGKSYYPESLDDLFKQQKDVMKKNFAKEELEIELVMTDSDPHYEPPLSVESILTAVRDINQNQSYYKERWYKYEYHLQTPNISDHFKYRIP